MSAGSIGSLGAALVAALLFGFAQPASGAEEPALGLPIACTPGADCWPFQFFDHDAGPGAEDYACGARSYDGHTGTDFALRDTSEIAKGVRVLAAAAGKVRAVRDGMPDRLFDSTAPGDAADKGCGNGVAIEHSDGWETQYCHLRSGSVRVRSGQTVAAGETLGTVGLSGRTQFPHLELIVRHRGTEIDPFTGATRGRGGCGAGEGTLWNAKAAAALRYSPVDILAVGVTGSMPSDDRAFAGEMNETLIPANAPLLAAWVTLGGVRDGDRLTLSLVGPDGRTVADTEQALTRTQIRYFLFVGDRAQSPWPTGDYVAKAKLARGRELTRTAEAVVRVR